MEENRHLPVMNIGIVGHVDHGKTTLTQMLTGKFTDEHSEELKRGISIRLGYADLTIKRCSKCGKYTTFDMCFEDSTPTEVLRTYSIIDAPGHETLIATVLTGTALIDAAILVIAANEPCPQPQTEEHLTALEIAGIDKILIVQNKIDLVSKEKAMEHYRQIKEFVKGTIAENAPIIPVSAHHNSNLDVLLEYIYQYFTPPFKNENLPPVMYVARSFDVNRPGKKINEMVGGVLGGAVRQGVFKKGEKIKILPGIRKEKKLEPVITTIEKMMQSGREIEMAKPGGLIAISTLLDPYFTKGDGMVGNIVVKEDNEDIKVYYELPVRYTLIERIIEGKKKKIVDEIKVGDALLINIGTARTVGVCTSKEGDLLHVKLKLPVAAFKGDRCVLSMQIDGRWRLIGYGEIS